MQASQEEEAEVAPKALDFLFTFAPKRWSKDQQHEQIQEPAAKTMSPAPAPAESETALETSWSLACAHKISSDLGRTSGDF